MDNEYRAMRFLKRCEFWSFTIAAIALVWWGLEMWSVWNV